MRRDRPKERGVVVAMVLIIIAGIAFIGFEAMRVARMDLASSAVLRTRVLDEGLMDAGLALARDLLAQDEDRDDGPYDVWNYFPSRCENLGLYFTTGSITGIIEDENSRFAVNSMAVAGGKNPDRPYGFLLRLVETLALGHGLAGDPAEFTDEVYNWVRPAEGEGNLDSKYLALAVPVLVPHRPMRCIEELLLMEWPGVGKKDVETLYYGTEHIPGLRDLLSVQAKGPLNMNTAHRLLVYAAAEDEDMARKINFVERVINYRNNPANSVGWEWYLQTAHQAQMEDTVALSILCGFYSSTFRVSLTATTGLGRRHAVAIFERNGTQVALAQIAF